jgi:hypothetical protein
MIYNHAACVQQHWTREAECVLTGISAARRFSPAQMLRDALTFSLRGLLSRIWRTVRSHRGSRELGPLLDVIAQFRETEAFYPVIFSPEPDAALTKPAVRTVPNRARLLEAEENFHTIFFHHHDGLLPLIEGWGE